jgi:cysteine desulfurase/selenocysteine lyase
MEPMPSFAAHEPSPEDLSRIAARLLSEAAGSDAGPLAATAVAPAMPAASAPTGPQAFAMPSQPFAPSREPFAAAAPQPVMPAAARVTESRALGVPPNDLSGLRAFVARIRGVDAFAPPTAVPQPNVALPSGVAGFGFFDVDTIRRDFPVLHQQVHGRPLAWFDNAATTQKPRQVIETIVRYYEQDNSNIHRAAHALAARSTDAYEGARRTVQRFLGAAVPEEIIFVRGTTEGINLVAQSCGSLLRPGDEILLTELEHHANIVPWQLVAERTGAVIRVAPINERGEVLLDAYASLLGPRTKFVALSHASNSLGTILPVELMTGMAKARGARVLVDGAQSVSHFPVDVRRIGCDFYVFSGHKIFGPTGIGAVYATTEAQSSMPPWQGGGNMIRDVTFAKTTYADPPAKFEAGTPNIADAIGLAAALDYVASLGRERIAAYEHELLEHATRRLSGIDGLRLIGTAPEKVGVLSFVLPGRDPIEIGKALDREGFAVRAGHHCAQPSLRHFGLEATVRPSLAFYNTHEEIDRLAEAIRHIARR